jgi:hypothetical protein
VLNEPSLGLDVFSVIHVDINIIIATAASEIVTTATAALIVTARTTIGRFAGLKFRFTLALPRGALRQR